MSKRTADTPHDNGEQCKRFQRAIKFYDTIDKVFPADPVIIKISKACEQVKRTGDSPHEDTEQCKRFKASIDNFYDTIAKDLPVDPVITKISKAYEHVKRTSDSPGGDTEQCKRFKASIEESLDKSVSEFICPITQELPVDPVIAEDCTIYERNAIQQWFTHHTRSPATNLQIGTNIVPVVQVKKWLRFIIKSGVTISCRANALRNRITDEIEIEIQQRLASGGDINAALRLAVWYWTGEHSLQQKQTTLLQVCKDGIHRL